MISVKRDSGGNEEEWLKTKEQAVLELGSLLAKTNMATGKPTGCSCDRKSLLAKFSEFVLKLL